MAPSLPSVDELAFDLDVPPFRTVDRRRYLGEPDRRPAMDDSAHLPRAVCGPGPNP